MAALFAIMTKVGVYAILRVHGVVFGAAAGDSAYTAAPVLLPLALATCLAGALGALAAQTLQRLVAWLTVASVGTVLAALGLFSTAAWGAALYYMAHSTLVVAGLFLLTELVAAQRGDAADRLVSASPVAQPALLGLMLLLAAASVAGLPPLSGFIGKLMILQASSAHALQATVWAVVLGAGFLALVGLARAGSVLFWNVNQALPRSGASGASASLVGAALWLLGASVLMSLLAAPIQRYTAAPRPSCSTVPPMPARCLGPQGEATQSTRPYRGTPGSGGAR